MKKLSLFFFLCSLFWATQAQLTSRIIGGTSDDVFRHSVQTPDGGYVSVSEHMYQQIHYYGLIKVNSTGGLDWSYQYNRGGYDERISKIYMLDDTTLFLIGYSKIAVGGDWDIVTIKIKIDGSMIGRKTYQIPNNQITPHVVLAVTQLSNPTRDFIIGGARTTIGTDYDAYAMCISPQTGNMSWYKEYKNATGNINWFEDFIELSNGHILAVGGTHSHDTLSNRENSYYVVLNANNGNMVGGDNNLKVVHDVLNQQFFKLVKLPDNTIVALGGQSIDINNRPSLGITLTRFDAAGNININSQKRYDCININSQYADNAQEMILDNDSLIISGINSYGSNDPNIIHNLLLSVNSSTGNVIWGKMIRTENNVLAGQLGTPDYPYARIYEVGEKYLQTSRTEIPPSGGTFPIGTNTYSNLWLSKQTKLNVSSDCLDTLIHYDVNSVSLALFTDSAIVSSFNPPIETSQDNVVDYDVYVSSPCPGCIPDTLCAGEEISAIDLLMANGFTGNISSISGSWYKDGTLVGSTYTLTVNQSGNYTFVGTIQYNGVITPVEYCYDIVIHTPPTLTATASPSTICVGQTSTLSVTGGPMNAMYHWYRMPATNIGTGMTRVVSPSVTTTYYVVLDCVPCSDTAWVTVTVVQPTPATITGPSAICGTQNVTLTAYGGGTYAWRLMPNNTIIGTNPTLTVNNVNTTRTYNVTVTNAPCPTTTASHTITVNPIPVVTLPVPQGCKIVGQALTFTATSASSLSWTWGNIPNTPTGITPNPNILSTSSSATYMMVPGTSVVSVTATNPNTNCTKTSTVSVTPANLIANITQQQSGPCNSYKFTASLAGYNGSTGTPLTYTWVVTNLTSNTQAPPIYTTFPINYITQLFANPGIDNYQVCVTITTTLGCTASTCINPVLPPCNCNIAANFCSTVGTPPTTGTAVPVIFTNGSTGGGATNLAYTWNWGDGTPNTTTTSINPQTHNFAAGVTSSNVELTVTGLANGMQCCQRVNIPVSIPVPCPITSTNVTGFNYKLSSTGLITFYANVAPPANCTYLWDFGNGATSTLASPTYTYSIAGTYNVCLTITHTPTGCNKKFCQSIIAAVPSCTIIPRYTATHCTGSALDISFTAVNNTALPIPTGVTYNWDFGDGNTQSTVNATTTHTYAAVGTYTVCLQKVTANCTTNVCHTFNVQMPTYTNCSPAPQGLKTTQGDDKGTGEELVPLDGNNWLLNKVEIIPNPAKQLTHLHFNLANNAEVRMEAFSLEGKVVWEKNASLSAGQQIEEISLSTWAAGMYIIRISTGDEVQNIKLVVEN